MPIEQLAQLLLECAQADAALPRRTPANDDAEHARSVDDMYDRIEALPELRREPQSLRIERQASPPVVPPASVASNEELEELVAIALTSAQDAEDVSREANVASRRARRGMVVAVGLAAIGIAIAGATTLVAQLNRPADSQMADIARQVQTLSDLQRDINSQLTQLQAQHAVQEANAGQAQHAVQEANAGPTQAGDALPARPTDSRALAPLVATPVGVLPAEPAAPLTSPGNADQAARSEPRPVSYAPAASDALYPPALPAASVAPAGGYDGRRWVPYHPPVARYRARVVLPRPVAYFIGSVRRDVRTMFR